MHSKTSFATIPADVTRRKRGDLEFLADLSPRDKPADEHKAWSEKMAAALLPAGLSKQAARVRDCAEAVFFHMHADNKNGEIGLKLHSAPYCHYRHCPTCQWRRSLKAKATVMSALPGILQKYPAARFVMLTLTIRNCPVSDLRETVGAMNAGWKRLILRKDWPALGWLRAVEVTRGKDGSAHPHYHCLLMLPPEYFSRNYLPTKAWVQLWREAMRLDYDPVCDVRIVRVKPGREMPDGTDARLLAVSSAVSEVVKYATKASDLLQGGPEWLREYVEQVRNLKFATSGGVLKGILTDVRPKNEDLVHVGGEEEVDGAVLDKLAFHWRTKHQAYARKRGGGGAA